VLGVLTASTVVVVDNTSIENDDGVGVTDGEDVWVVVMVDASDTGASAVVIAGEDVW